MVFTLYPILVTVVVIVLQNFKVRVSFLEMLLHTFNCTGFWYIFYVSKNYFLGVKIALISRK
jgi:hypothetical protein